MSAIFTIRAGGREIGERVATHCCHEIIRTLANFSRTLIPARFRQQIIPSSPAAEGGFRKRQKLAGDGASPFEPSGCFEPGGEHAASCAE